MRRTHSRKLIALMVLIPVLALAGLGWQLQQSARVEAMNQAAQWREAQLQLLDQQVMQWMERLAHRLNAQWQAIATPSKTLADAEGWAYEDRLATSATIEAVRQYLRGSPYVKGLYLADSNLQRVFPPLSFETPSERAFLARTDGLWRDLSGFKAPQASESDASAVVTRWARQSAPLAVAREGWRNWYADAGMELIYWQRTADGLFVAFELNSVRLLADVISLLPDQRDVTVGEKALIRLVDERGGVIHQWGRLQDAETQVVTRQHLSPPFGSWRLEYLTLPEGGIEAQSLGLLLSLGAVVLVLAGLGVYLYREQHRDWLEARQRVNFVNQVSHELKTPMTSIRLYAELLERHLDEQDERARHYLGVITGESERLSQLIENVLSFSKQQNGKLKLRQQPIDLPALIARVGERFRPALAQQGLQLQLEIAAMPVLVGDEMALDQILSNLLGNAEKYARGGQQVRVGACLVPASGQEAGALFRIEVTDDGPGIPDEFRETIFEPFVRLKNALTEGVSGTGIGLHIARELARAHRGDLLVCSRPKGACFALTIGSLEDTGA